MSRSSRAIAGIVSASFFAIQLAACGGGGGGSDAGGGTAPPPPPAPPPPANRAPVVGASSFAIAEDSELSGQLAATDPDGDALTFSRTSEPGAGILTALGPAGSFTYRPNRDFWGTDSFGFRVSDRGGHTAEGTVTITIAAVNDSPVATNDVMRAEGAALAKVDVLENDRDPDGDTLAVAIEGPASVGTATVNADGSIHVADLPAGFRGLTRFQYRVADASGASSVATVAVFVGIAPFRVVLAGEEAPGAPEVYMTDFVSPAWRLTAATEGGLRLRSFVASDNGATVVYRRESAGSSGTSQLAVVRTSVPEAQIPLALPDGQIPAPDALGDEQYTVSPDGRWVAVIGGAPGSDLRRSLYVLDVEAPARVRPISPDGALYAGTPRFSSDSKHVYFLAAGVPGSARSLYRAAIDAPDSPVRLSASNVSAGPGADDALGYGVSPDQSRIILEAIRGGRPGLYFIDPALPGTEVLLSHPLAPGESLVSSTMSLAPNAGGSASGRRVAYTVLDAFQSASTYVADVGSNPNPRLIADAGAYVVGLRPDDAALLYTKASLVDLPAEQVLEAVIDSASPHERVGGGSSAVYDSTADVIVLRQTLTAEGGGSPGYPALARAVRGAFGDTAMLGTPGSAVASANLSSVDRGVVLMGEAPLDDPAPRSARLALVNALAPDRLLFLASFESPLGLSSDAARVVTY